MSNFITAARRIKVFDIEGDALAEVNKAKGVYQPEISRIWCVVVQDIEGGEARRYGPDRIDEAVADLLDCDALVGHNILDYDWRVIERFYGPFSKRPELIDTLVMSRCQHPDPQSNPRGGNSLEAWGDHLGLPKGDFKDFSKYSEEMLDYCERDVAITLFIFRELDQWLGRMLPDRRAVIEGIIDAEHRFAFEMARQCEIGISFSIEEAIKVLEDFESRRLLVVEELREIFAPRVETMKKPAYYETESGEKYETIGLATKMGVRRRDLKAGPPKTKTYPFNPDSRDECAARLIDVYGWKPVEFTDGGKPKMSEDVMVDLPYPAAQMMAEYLTLGKRISQLSDLIERAYLSRDHKIHGSVNHYGAKTGRCSHSQPNLAQIPRVNKPFGSEFRKLFIAAGDRNLVGADAKGLELRMLADRMWEYDGGEYAEVVCTGDVHTLNMEMAGLDNRDQAKTFIYGFLYGAGDAKIGKIVGGDEADGARLRSKFLANIPAIRYVREAVITEARTRNKIRLVDGRDVPVRAEHSALNDALQGDGAVLMKHVFLYAISRTVAERLPCRPVLNVHDEFQWLCPSWESKRLASLLEEAFTIVGKELGFQVPIEGEAKIGKNWSETH